MREPLRRRRTFSPLLIRILTINLIALLAMVGGQLYAGRYQSGLIAAEQESLRFRAQLIADAIAQSAVLRRPGALEVVDRVVAGRVIERFSRASDMRVQIIGATGGEMLDSHRLGSGNNWVEVQALPAPRLSAMSEWRQWADFGWQWLTTPPPPADVPRLTTTAGEGAIRTGLIVTAMNGEQGHAIWLDQDGVLTLTTSIPIQRYRRVIGTVLASTDGARIAAEARVVQGRGLQIGAGMLVITILLSWWLSSSIAQPLRRLARAAEAVQHAPERAASETGLIPNLSGRRDEIGELAAALRRMTAALSARIQGVEKFAADVSHELKNPLSSIRSAIETMPLAKDPARLERLMTIARTDIDRLDRLITDIADISRLDAALLREHTESVDLLELLGGMVAHEQQIAAEADDGEEGGDGTDAVQISLSHIGNDDFTTVAVPERLGQVFRNLIDNARSFSPPGGTIAVTLTRADGWIDIAVVDDGPGIPEANPTSIFERFYSERPAHAFGIHSGLGLAIARQIIASFGGEIWAENRYGPGGRIHGAVLRVRLPAELGSRFSGM
jgi:two-component system sensor histidine kinase ChvG